MTNLFSTISGYFSRSLILGTFLPTVIFVVLALFFVVPLMPGDTAILKPLESLDPQWKIVAITFVVIIISGLIYNLNIPIIRIYEGYTWKESLLGAWRLSKYQKRFDDLTAREQRCASLLLWMDSNNEEEGDGKIPPSAVISELKKLSPELLEPGSLGLQAQPSPQTDETWAAIYYKVLLEWNELKRRLNNEFPGKRFLVLPTRLGNLIRSFEYYPDREYEMDAVTLWPRLIAKVDKDYAVAVDDAKTSFDFMINCSALSGVMAFTIIVVCMVYPSGFATGGQAALRAAAIVSFALISYGFYLLSIPRAGAWGEMVKGAFDLYRGNLLQALGYQNLPKDRAAERALWASISLQMMLGDSRSGPRIPAYGSPPAPPPIFACGTPADVPLEVTKGTGRVLGDAPLTITLHVENVDDKKRSATGVVVTDTLPEGYLYERDSARVAHDGAPHVSGVNPYKFHIGSIEAGTKRVLTYRAIRVRDEPSCTRK